MSTNKTDLVVVELSHINAPIEVREKLTMDQDEILQAYNYLNNSCGQVFILSTCNRLAVYSLTDNVSPILQFFRSRGIEEKYIHFIEGKQNVCRHLCATSSGLFSQALGEHEILGQIKKAYDFALKTNFMGAELKELVKRAITIGKKVRKDTDIGKYPVSLASVSFDIIKQNINNLEGKNILVFGTGEMASLMLKVLEKSGAHRIFVASKSQERAQKMASLIGGIGVSNENALKSIDTFDIIIGATYTKEPLVNSSKISKNNKFLFVDLGLPRNFDLDIKSCENAKLFDLDDVKTVTGEGMLKRKQAVPLVQSFIDKEIEDYVFWLNSRKASPVISSYYKKVEQIQNEELLWALPKMGQLDENQIKIMEQAFDRMARRLSGKPIEKLKDFAQKSESKDPIDLFRELFDLNN